MEVLGTLKGEKVRTIVVVLDGLPGSGGPGRLTCLCACPVSSWAEGSRDLELFVASLRRL
jgi:hypothetical protein